MAKFELRFYSIDSDLWWIKCEKDIEENYISITAKDEDDNCITLGIDKSTAIKFAKTLRTEINKITESEGENGGR